MQDNGGNKIKIFINPFSPNTQSSFISSPRTENSKMIKGITKVIGPNAKQKHQLLQDQPKANPSKPPISGKYTMINKLVHNAIKKEIQGSAHKNICSGKCTPAQSPRTANLMHAGSKNKVLMKNSIQNERNISKKESVTRKNSIESLFLARKMSYGNINNNINVNIKEKINTETKSAISKIIITNKAMNRTPSLMLDSKKASTDLTSAESIKNENTKEKEKNLQAVTGSTGEYSINTGSFAIKMNDPIAKEREQLIQSNKLCIKYFDYIEYRLYEK